MGMTGIHMLQSPLGFPLALQPSCLALLALPPGLCGPPPALSLSPPRHLTYAHSPSVSIPHIWPLDCLFEKWSHYISLPGPELAM